MQLAETVIKGRPVSCTAINDVLGLIVRASKKSSARLCDEKPIIDINKLLIVKVDIFGLLGIFSESPSGADSESAVKIKFRLTCGNVMAKVKRKKCTDREFKSRKITFSLFDKM
jgi:hypothetical protein